MAVIDGKYEILSQRALDEQQTFFSATAPDGAALAIHWFDLTTPLQEASFERYRQLLRTLKKQGLAALHDIVSRPGAHYVVWYAPNSQPQTTAPPDLESALQAYGYSAAQADVRLDKTGRSVVYALAFGESDVPAAAPPPGPRVKGRARPSFGWHRLPTRWLRWGLGALLVGVGAGLFYTSFKSGVNDTLVTVPDLSAVNINEAARTLYRLRLAVVAEAAASAELPYSVLELFPKPGSALRPGATVRLSYALPAGQVALVTVPQLRGGELAGVAEQLEAAELRLGDVAYVHSNVAKNVVIAQSREAGQAPEGAAVHLLVSEGPQPQQTFLPDLVGLPLADARALAELAGVGVAEPETAADGRVAPGTVLAQSVPPYALVPVRGTDLRLTVAGGTEPPAAQPVPSLVGMTKGEAERTAAAAGYTLEVEAVANDADSLNLPEGVVSQTPPPGSATAGSSMSILLNQRPARVPRPAVRAVYRPLQERTLTYTFLVEQGVRETSARVVALTVADKSYEVAAARPVSGGETLTGEWRTSEFGPVTFQLFLGDDTRPYQQVKVNP